MRDTFLPYCLPMLGQEEIDEVVDTLRSGWITTGPKVQRFERQMADYLGAPHTLAVSSCTAALHLALAALGVGPGDEVITSTLTFASTCNVVVHLGATPVLVDIEPEFWQMDPEQVEAAITPRTRAIIGVHFSGHPCDVDRLRAVAHRHGVSFIEDAAHAVGARWRGIPIGADSLAACFSFYPIKNMTTGEGGMISTRDAALHDRARLLSLHGMSKDAWKRYHSTGSWYYEIVEPGYKYNMTDIQAALGIHQAARLERFIEIREEYARCYDEAFGSHEALSVPRVATDVRHARHLYPLLVESGAAGCTRDEFIEELRARNIGSTVNFIPIHRHPYYRERFALVPEMFPRAEHYYERTVSLPLYPRMTPADVETVVEAVLDIVDRGRRPASCTVPGMRVAEGTRAES